MSMMKNSDALAEIRRYKKQVLVDLLGQCTEKQIEVFNRMYGSVGTILEDKIDWAIVQCENTLKKKLK